MCAIAGGTHAGLRRSVNEDSYLLVQFPGAPDALLAVADGVGGEAAGEVASWFVLKYLLQERLGRREEKMRTAKAARRILVDGIEHGNAALHHVNNQIGGEHFAMGTTAAAAMFVPGRVVVVHAGDSRCYRLRGGHLLQITSDHTWAQNLAEVGEIEHHEVSGHPWEHTLSNCLGFLPHVHLEIQELRVRPGDRYLLCTDGVTQMVHHEEIARLLGTAADPQTVTDTIIEASLEAGGRDNIAVAVAAVG